MNQKLLLQLNQEVQNSPDPFCYLEEVAELYNLTCLLDDTIPDLDVPGDATPLDVQNILSGYLEERNISRGDSVEEVTLYIDAEFESADLEVLESIDDEYVFGILVSLVSLYSTLSSNSVYLTEMVKEHREDELSFEPDDEICKSLVDATTAILETKTAQAIEAEYILSSTDQIASIRKQLSLLNKDIPAFLATYVSDAVDSFETCVSEKFLSMIPSGEYDYDNAHPCRYTIFYLYPESSPFQEDLCAEVDSWLESDLQESAGDIRIQRGRYHDIPFFVEASKRYREVLANFTTITEAL